MSGKYLQILLLFAATAGFETKSLQLNNAVTRTPVPLNYVCTTVTANLCWIWTKRSFSQKSIDSDPFALRRYGKNAPDERQPSVHAHRQHKAYTPVWATSIPSWTAVSIPFTPTKLCKILRSTHDRTSL